MDPSQFPSTLRRDTSSNSNRWGDKRQAFGGSMSSLNKNYLQVSAVTFLILMDVDANVSDKGTWSEHAQKFEELLNRFAGCET